MLETVPRVPDGLTRPGGFGELHGGRPGGVRPESRQTQGHHPGLAKQTEAQPEAAPGTWGWGWGRISNGPPPALLLTPPGGHRLSLGSPDARSWAGRPAPLCPWEQSSVARPSQASADSHTQWLSQAGRQFSPFSRGQPAGLAPPAPVFLSGSCK